jgi:hypothetical protein
MSQMYKNVTVMRLAETKHPRKADAGAGDALRNGGGG